MNVIDLITCRFNLIKILCIGVLIGQYCAFPAYGWAQTDQSEADTTFTMYWENDAFTGTDRNYTNGFKLTWGKPYTAAREAQGGITKWMIDTLPFINAPDATRGTSISIGQNIYTPADTEARDLIKDDRPYAGFTYIGFGYQSKNNLRRDVWEIDIGVIGPLSQAQEVQNIVHDILDVRRTNGWDNQLDNEIGLGAICESKWRVWRSPQWHGIGFDFIPHLGGRFGNVAIYANTGAELRFGWYVPKDFGTCPIRPGCDVGESGKGVADDYEKSKYGVHLFASIDGRLVLRDIFLDGNTFNDSHSVNKEPVVADLMAGIAMRFGSFSLSYAYIMRSKEFEGQDKVHNFGALNLTYTF